ncbi:hypothetical protein EJ05DRAFT_476223 [Pseudovirgaria hyperparasitica]|uniref:TIM-barrel domain-containing protein n=1 Tax=Pseudovirgaria hyperparasitica TaxID=470096 RepID=A0A6A6W7J9_9PEZI|nr:uncharacterized protein EJ05DRAFT_476223 [Pseudovirgaria hyperparasitica]KAF2757930.1 hypothetical protein EJ05DRAFT_476223 [Pseudovirgaria hyperparasitica]
MPPPTDRQEILKRLRDAIAEGRAIVGAGAGIGLSAKSFEAGGGDLIIIYNSGRYRMAGRGSLAGLQPYGNANDIVLEMANEIVSIVKQVPVLAGVCASDPFRSLPTLLADLRGRGIAGVQNFPTVGLIDADSVYRQNLEETGMGYDTEVELIKLAHSMDMLTTPYAFNAKEAKVMTEAGADVIVAHMGLTSSGAIGAKKGKTLEECVKLVQEIYDAAIAVNKEVIVLCHGGPIAQPQDAKFVLEQTNAHGFYGASSMERLPVETAIAEVTQKFRAIKTAPR